MENSIYDICVPGMSVFADDLFRLDNESWRTGQDLWSIVEEYHRRGLFNNEDVLTNTIRFGACRLINDAMTAWEDCLDDLPSEVIELYDLCQEPGDAASIPWKYFREALPWLLYHAPSVWGVCLDDVLDNAEDYYDVTVHTVAEDDGRVTVEIGANWADAWAIEFTCGNCIESINSNLPYYMAIEGE